jgi:plastocyanin
MARPPRLIAVAALLLLPLLGVACGGSSGSSTPAAAGHVNVLDNRFDPTTVTVSVGDTVTWDFKGAVAHNVTGPGFKSANMKSGTFAHQFNSAGNYDYVCTIHQGMKGTVKVG